MDEKVEPGVLFDWVVPLMAERGVMQMNHPFAESSFGRDEGFLTAIGYDPRHVIGTLPRARPKRSSPSGRPAAGPPSISTPKK